MPQTLTHNIPQDAFPLALRPGLVHLIGALPQLRSYNDMGHTVYALTVYGTNRGAIGAASLAGPAVSASGVSADWPEEAQHAAKSIFARSNLRKAGAVVVVLIVQVGRDSHCILINVPTPARERARRESEIPLSCAASVLAYGC